jgi:hypothetical protein
MTPVSGRSRGAELEPAITFTQPGTTAQPPAFVFQYSKERSARGIVTVACSWGARVSLSNPASCSGGSEIAAWGWRHTCRVTPLLCRFSESPGSGGPRHGALSDPRSSGSYWASP